MFPWRSAPLGEFFLIPLNFAVLFLISENNFQKKSSRRRREFPLRIKLYEKRTPNRKFVGLFPLMTQEEQVVAKLQELGGCATLKRLYEVLDFSSWGTKTPFASVRRIVQIPVAVIQFTRDFGDLSKRAARWRETWKWMTKNSHTHFTKELFANSVRWKILRPSFPRKTKTKTS